MAYQLTKNALILDLHAAFQSAKRHKSSRPYVRIFERDLSANLEVLADDLLTHRYEPEPSSCFVVEHPKKREVFAAQFRDRVVHHLYYNYTHVLFERTFIQDSYSCIPNRGTLYGIERMQKHIRQESLSYQRPCHVMKLDIRGYFMHINRRRLLEITTKTLLKMSRHTAPSEETSGARSRRTWGDVLDMDFILWLTEKIIMMDPKISCRIVGSIEDWNGLDKNKSLFWTEEGCGLPIGNLTSQLFSNVYMNVFDQWMKHEMKCKHYGRYVDDAYVVSHDKAWLLSLVPKIDAFLREELGLELHRGKLLIADAKRGVEFLGAYAKPFCRYVSNATLERMLRSMREMDLSDKEHVWRSINSFLGTMCHYNSYNIRCHLFLTPDILRIGCFDEGMTTFERLAA